MHKISHKKSHSRPFQSSTKVWFKSIWMHHLCSCRYESLLSLCCTVNTPSHLHPSLTNCSSTTSEEGFCTSQKRLLWVGLLSIIQSLFWSLCNADSPLYPAAHCFHYASYHFRRGYIIYLLPSLCLEVFAGAGTFLLLFGNVHIVRSAHRRRDFHFALIPVVLF